MRSAVVVSGIDADAGGIAQDGLRELDDARRERGGEEQRLAVGRKQRDDAFHIAGEAHVEHPVHFIEHEELDAGEIHGALFDQVEQTSGSRHQHVHAAAHRGNLGILADAAVNQRLLEADVGAVSGEAFADLAGEFAGRSQHQRAALARLDLLRPLMDRMEDGQGETRGFSGAGLGATEKVAAFEQQRDGLRLDRRWGGVVQFAQNTLEGRSQWQRLEFIRGHVVRGACLIPDGRQAVSMSGWSNLKQSLIDEDRKRVEPFNRLPARQKRRCAARQ